MLSYIFIIHFKCVKEMHTRFWLENLKGRDHSEDLGIDGKIILEWILGKWGEGVDWMHMA
jgi:hypothetical protein